MRFTYIFRLLYVQISLPKKTIFYKQLSFTFAATPAAATVFGTISLAMKLVQFPSISEKL